MKKSTRVKFLRKKKKKIADTTIPHAWKESDWPNAQMRTKVAAEAYEKLGQKLDLKTFFNIAHRVSIETEINWEQSIEYWRDLRKKI